MLYFIIGFVVGMIIMMFILALCKAGSSNSTPTTLENNKDDNLNNNVLTILMGPAGSGKSTFAKMQLKGLENCTRIVSMDAIREKLCGDASDQSRNNEVFNNAMREIEKYGTLGYDVIYDATNLTYSTRKILADRFKDDFKHIVLIYLKRGKETCLKQNKMRERVVPEEVIEKQFNKLQEPDELKEDYFFNIITL